jgi:hypothetical protein
MVQQVMTTIKEEMEKFAALEKNSAECARSASVRRLTPKRSHA